MTLNKIHLIYNPKDKGTFHSARWRKDYSPHPSLLIRPKNLTYQIRSKTLLELCLNRLRWIHERYGSYDRLAKAVIAAAKRHILRGH
jgi:hypothetical protein